MWKVYVAGDQVCYPSLLLFARACVRSGAASNQDDGMACAGLVVLMVCMPLCAAPLTSLFRTRLQVFWAERKSTPHSRSLFRTRLQVFWAERKSSPDLRILAEQLAADPEAGKAHVLDISMQMVHTAVCPRASAFTVMASHTHTPPTCVPSKPCRCAR